MHSPDAGFLSNPPVAQQLLIPEDTFLLGVKHTR